MQVTIEYLITNFKLVQDGSIVHLILLYEISSLFANVQVSCSILPLAVLQVPMMLYYCDFIENILGLIIYINEIKSFADMETILKAEYYIICKAIHI